MSATRPDAAELVRKASGHGLPRSGRNSGDHQSGNGLLIAQLRRADLLFQVDALAAAAECLDDIARCAPDAVKARALARLSRIEGECGHAGAARLHLDRAMVCAQTTDRALGDDLWGELLAARCWNAVSDGDIAGFKALIVQLAEVAARTPHGDDAWSLLAAANLYACGYLYARQDIGEAVKSYDRATAALAHAASVPPVVVARALIVCAALDMHDPERVHLSKAENEAIFRLSLENGMVASACDALHNILIFSLYCDDPLPDATVKALAREAIRDENAGSIYGGEAMLISAAMAALGQFDEAIKVIEDTRAGYRGEMFAWSPRYWTPAFSTFESRLLYKVSRFDDSERLAARAAGEWERAGLGAGPALRVRAESLEALGRHEEALAAIHEALDTLETFSPVHHLLASYACAHRLTNRRSYREKLHYLAEALRKPSRSTDSATLTPRDVPARSGLTRREREVALLVADGLTNPEIGRRLGISRKTVANHVATIFDRLGMRARWQITREIVRSA